MPQKNIQQLVLDKFSIGMIDEGQLSTVEFPQGSAISAVNVVFMPTGGVRKRKGLEVLNDTPLKNAPISKIWQWANTSNSEYTFVFTSLSGAASATINTMITTGATSFNSILVTSGTWDPTMAADGSDEPISITSYAGSAVFTFAGSNMGPVCWDSQIANTVTLAAAISGAKCVLGWGNYLFLGNVLEGSTRKGSRVQWCYPASPTNWPAAYYIDLDPDDGDEITALVGFQNLIVVFKKYKLFVLHYVGGRYQFQEERISTSVGCVGANAWMDSGDSLYFLGPYTAYVWDGKSVPKSISDKVQSSFNNMNIANWMTCEVDADDENWEILFSVADGASNYKNCIYAYDTRFQSWTLLLMENSALGGISYGKNEAYQDNILAYSTYDTRIADALGAKDPLITIGTYAGKVAKYGTSDDDYGVAVDGYWRSRWLDFDKPDINKRILRVTALVQKEGDYSLNVSLYTDWNEATPSSTQTISLSGGITTGLIERRVDFHNTYARSLQVKIGTSGSSQPFILYKVFIDYLVKGRKMHS